MYVVAILVILLKLSQLQTKLFGTVTAVLARVVVRSVTTSANTNPRSTSLSATTAAHVLTKPDPQMPCKGHEIPLVTQSHERTMQSELVKKNILRCNAKNEDKSKTPRRAHKHAANPIAVKTQLHILVLMMPLVI